MCVGCTDINRNSPMTVTVMIVHTAYALAQARDLLTMLCMQYVGLVN